MGRLCIAGALTILLGLCPCSGLADNACESTAAPDSVAQALIADEQVVARLLFITFPDAPQTDIPDWAEDYAEEFEDYIAAMSHGAQEVICTVVRRPVRSDKAWVAPQNSSVYRQTIGGYATCNRSIMEQVRDSLGSNAWTEVEYVVAVHYRKAFWDSVGWAGVRGVGCGQCGVSYMGKGNTQRLPNDELNESGTEAQAGWITAHEYGHDLGMLHTPGSLDDGGGVNPGRYDVMRTSASHVGANGFAPYHAIQLGADYGSGPGWLPARVQIVANMENLRVPDVRGNSPKTFELQVGGSSPAQSFTLVNHQTANNPFDAKYQTSGLYIWHSLHTASGYPPLPGVALDLESADGKFVRPGTCGGSYATPDPVSGDDLLEDCSSHSGSAADAFDGSVKTRMTCATNPNTNLYATNSYASAQSVKTSVAFENIRHDGSDILLDVYITPRQKLTTPNTGGTYGSGTVPVTWTTRSYACITDVDIEMSRDGGSTYELIAEDEANDGSYTWSIPPGEYGDQYRIRVKSFDEAGGVGMDTSDVSFEIPEPCPPWEEPCDDDPGFASAIMTVQGPVVVQGGELTMSIDLPRSGLVRVDVHDVMGRRVGGRAPAWMEAGRSRAVRIKQPILGSGVYLVRVSSSAGDVTRSKFVVIQ